MADHNVKLSEVPKGKRLAYFWDYYKIHTIVAILLLAATVSILKSTVFRTKEDAFILIAGTGSLSEQTVSDIRTALNSMDIDVNGDGKIKNDVVGVSFLSQKTENSKDTDMELEAAQSMKMSGVLSTGNYIIQIADEKMADYLIAQNVVAKPQDFSNKYYTVDENYVKIPISATKLAKAFGNYADNYFIVVRGKDRVSTGSNKKMKNYENQIKVLNKIVE